MVITESHHNLIRTFHEKLIRCFTGKSRRRVRLVRIGDIPKIGGGGVSSGSGMVHGQRTADVTDLLMQAIRLQRIRSAYDKDPDRIIKAQQALKDDGIYSGPVDRKSVV